MELYNNEVAFWQQHLLGHQAQRKGQVKATKTHAVIFYACLSVSYFNKTANRLLTKPSPRDIICAIHHIAKHRMEV